MSRSGHRQRLPCASLVTHLACTNTTFCSKISKYIVAAMKKDNFTKRAKPTVLGSTRSNFPRHCALSLGNYHTGPNEDAGFAGQFRMQNCTRGRLVLESRCERIANLFQTTKIQDKIKVHRKLHLSLPRIGILEVPRPNLALARSHPKTAGEKIVGEKYSAKKAPP